MHTNTMSTNSMCGPIAHKTIKLSWMVWSMKDSVFYIAMCEQSRWREYWTDWSTAWRNAKITYNFYVLCSWKFSLSLYSILCFLIFNYNNIKTLCFYKNLSVFYLTSHPHVFQIAGLKKLTTESWGIFLVIFWRVS